MTVMLVVLAAWVVFSLLVGLVVGRAIRQADSAESPARPAEPRPGPTAPSGSDGAPGDDAEPIGHPA